eukprot:356861-Chlamydomonas_euryale.AAC.15
MAGALPSSSPIKSPPTKTCGTVRTPVTVRSASWTAAPSPRWSNCRSAETMSAAKQTRGRSRNHARRGQGLGGHGNYVK